MLIYFQNLKKEFLSKVLFSGVRLKIAVEKGEKIGVVGKNGEGKTTLLKMIAGIEYKDYGNIKFEPKRTRVFYISVDNVNTFEGSTEEFLLSSNPYIFGLKNKLDSLTGLLNDEKYLEEYGVLIEQYEKVGGYVWEERVLGVLKKLQLAHKNLSTLSGGEKSRLILGVIQVVDADLILLDEPTNHLDIVGLQELEDFLLADKKSYIIVSHDQAFLNNVVTKILDIEREKVYQYEGNYSDYKRQKELKEKQKLEEFLENQKEIKRLSNLAKDIIETTSSGMSKVVSPKDASVIKGKKFTNAQGKRLIVARDKDKMSTHYFNQKLESKMRDAKIVKRRIERIGNVQRPEKDWGIKINLNSDASLSDFVLKTKNISTVLKNTNDDKYEIASSKASRNDKNFSFPDVSVMSGQKVAIIGPNGIGKTTLARIIVGLNKNFKGEVVIPESVTIGYYSQTHESLIPEKSVLLNLLSLDRIEDYDTPAVKEARNFLHQMLFTGDNTLQKVKDLSQGEKSKLALAKIIYENPKFLVLDEPTNHLDIPSKERLESALKQYKGAMLIISHDRYFMESIGVEEYIELS